MCGGAWTWENYKPFFEDRGYECVSTTLRYHDIDPEDEPDPLLGTTSLLDYAEDLEREIRLLDSKPVIMGHSMGGLLAQQLAARGLAKSLVLLAPATPAGIFSIRPSVIKSFWSAITKWKFWEKSFRQTYDEAV